MMYHTQVLLTNESGVQVLHFSKQGLLAGRSEYPTRQEAVRVLQKALGRKVELKPMQTMGAERVNPGEPLEDITRADE